MSLWKLRFSMLGTLAVVIGLSTLFFAVVLQWIGAFDIVAMLFLVVFFNLVQWLLAPYIIDAIYRVRKVSSSESPGLYGIVESLSRKIGINMPRVMIANIPMPNAFAYGSPIAGTRIAVTTGLLKELEDEEVEAVVGHELGHLKHRDVQIMMFASVLPAIFYYIGYSLMLSSWYGGGRKKEGEGATAAAIGMASMVMYWILTLFVLGLSRLREYYADQMSATVVEDGPRKLSEALAKIVYSTGRMKRMRRGVSGFDSFKTLFISDPNRAETDALAMAQAREFGADRELVREVLERKVTLFDTIMELFSTHPNIVKRIRALQQLA